MPKVYISRRSLKHFIERRKEEMTDKYIVDIIFDRLDFAIEHLIPTMQRYDWVEEIGNKRIYSKYFETQYKSDLRVVAEFIIDHWEIKSIHFHKNKKAT